MQAVYHFRIPHAVPLDGDISFKDLADKCGVDGQQMARLIRHAMTFHVFHEPRPGYVAHTADSRLLVEDSTLYDLTGTLLEDLRPASLKVTDAMEKWPSSQEANQTGWQLAYDTNEEMYNHLAKDPERLRRFGQHLVHIARQDPRTVDQVASAYPWSDVQSGTVVDLGGGNGQYSIGIAQRHHSPSFIVQDKSGVSETGQSSLPIELKERVSFMAHDMFDVQPIKDADIYFLRHVFHNWSDKYCVQILRALVPSLKPGARVLICDLVIPEKGEVPMVTEKEVRRIDLMMMSLFNARERSVPDVKSLFEQADKRLKFNKAYDQAGALDKIVEAVWTPGDF